MRGTAQRLESLEIAANPTNMAFATRLMLDARAEADRELRLGIDTVSEATVSALSSERQPALVAHRFRGWEPEDPSALGRMRTQG